VLAGSLAVGQWRRREARSASAVSAAYLLADPRSNEL
jgi:hypothetical protein